MQTRPVQVFRFDRDIAMKLPDGDRSAQLGQLLGPSAIDQAGLLYLDADDEFSTRSAGSSLLIAVVSGAGYAMVAGRDPFEFVASQALVFEANESWSVRASVPIVALCAEGTFELWAVAVTKELEVVTYDPAWPDSFARIRDALEPVVGDVALRIDHVGSTAVPDLDAKPIIDLDVVVAHEDSVSAVVTRLADAGYRWRGDLGVPGREVFDAPADSPLPTHHLYLVVEGNRAHLNHLLLRDELRNDPQLRHDYAALKRRNAELARGNMDIYIAAKANFVADVLTRARRERGLAPVDYWVPDA